MRRFLILALLVSVQSLFAQDPKLIERRLDVPLKMLHRAENPSTDRPAPSRDAAQRVLQRFQALPGKGLSGNPDMTLLVKFGGARAELEKAGFRVQSHAGQIFTGVVSAEVVSQLATLPGVMFVQTDRRLLASPVQLPSKPGRSAEQAAASNHPAPLAKMGGSGVIVGFVDTGVDVFHEDFRKVDGSTRIKYLLDFSIPGDLDGDGNLDGPGPFGGTLFTEADINTAITAGTFASRDTTGHGTHGLSIAAGDDSTLPGFASEADLIVVKATRVDGTLGFTSADIINALSFVDQKATELGKPYVANLSLGTLFSSHDGRSLEEQAVDALVGPGMAGKAIVIAAGNSSDNRGTRLRHMQGTANSGLATLHPLTVPAYTPNPGKGDDRILLDFWYQGNDKLKVTVTSPNGHVVMAPFGDYADTPTADGDVFIGNMGGPNPLNGQIEALVLIDDWSGTAPAAGTWTVTIEGQSIDGTGVYHGWLTDESAVGSTTPYLTGNADNQYLVAKPGGAWNGITAGSHAMHDLASRFRISWTDVNGGARVDTSAIDGDISDFSSPGRTTDGRIKPEITAPGERVMGAVSRDAYPATAPNSIYKYHPFPDPEALIVERTANHAFGMLQGTSFSAPVVTGLVARILSTAPTLDAVQIRNMLINSATADGFTGTVPNAAWGYGKVSLTVGGGGPLPQDLRITSETPQSATFGKVFNFVLTASGGKLPYAWAITSGGLPPGITLQNGGLLSGQPTSTGTFTFTVQVTDTSAPSQTASKVFQIVIPAIAPLQITKSTPPAGRVGKSYSYVNQAEGGTPPYTWTLAGGTLPPGLSLGTDGTISGTPTTLGIYDFTVKVTDSVAGTGYASLRIKVLSETGGNWDPLGKSNPTVNYIAIDPNNANHLMCSTRNIDAVFETTHGGETWRANSINNNVNGHARQIKFSPVASRPWLIHRDERVYESLFMLDPVSGVWTLRTTTWPGTPGAIQIAIDFNTLDRLYLLVRQPYTWGDTGVSTSTDNGQTWVLLGHWLSEITGPTANWGSLSVHAANPVYIYAAEFQRAGDLGHEPPGVSALNPPPATFATDDGGATWGNVTNASGGYFDIAVSSVNQFDVVKAGNYTTYGAVNISTDGGRHWTTVTPGFGLIAALRRSFSSPNILCVAASNGFYRSTDTGLTWQRLPINGQHPNVTALDIDPHDPNSIWIGADQGIYHSTDGGVTWAKKSNGLVHRTLKSIAVGNSNPDDLLLLATDGAYLSRSAGKRWVLATSGLGTGTLALPRSSAMNPDLWYVTVNGRLYRSETRGVTWSETAPTFDPTYTYVAYDVDPFNGNTVIAALNGSRGVYRSTDRGSTWSPAYTGLPVTEPTTIAFAKDVSGRVYAAFTSKGVYVSPDSGITWSSYGLSTQTVSLLAPAPSDSNYLYGYSGGVIQFRDPGVGTWQAATTNPLHTVYSLAVDATNPMVAYAGCDHPGTGGETGGIYKTIDGGRNWTRIPSALDSDDVLSVVTHPTTSGVVYAVTQYNGVYRSDNGGATWTELPNYGTVADLTTMTAKDPSNASVIIAGTEGYGVHVSADGGKTFVPRVTGLTNFYVNAIAFDPATPSTLYAATRAGIFKSTDSASSWAATGLTAGEVTDLVTDNEGTAKRIWATIKGQGIAYSSDGGVTFSLYSTGLASLELTSLEIETKGAAKRIWATTKGGDGVAYSDDLGHTWVSASGNGLTNRNVNDLAIQTGTAKRIWATTDSGVYFSENDGLSWTNRSIGIPSGVPVTSVSVDPNSKDVLVSLYAENGGGVYRGGSTAGVWTAFNSGLEELRVKKLTNDRGHVVNATTLGTTFYASTTGNGVFATEIQTATQNAPSITTQRLPKAFVRSSYSATLSATGGTAPYTWSVVDGALPAGVSLVPATGAFTGNPSATGVFFFTVQVADGNQQTQTKGLSIEVVSPDEMNVSWCSPGGGYRTQTLTATISGSGFLSGATASFGASVTVNSTTFVSSTQLTASVTIAADADAGWRVVAVTNPGGASAGLVDGFKVDYPAPVVSSVSPVRGSRKETLAVTITGQFFEPSATVDFGTGITVNASAWQDAQHISANITIQPTAALGSVGVTVRNLNGLSGSLSSAFEVRAAKPAVTAVTPPQGNQGMPVSVTITGTDFQTGASVSFGAGITVNSVTFVSATQLNASLAIAAGAALGLRDATVTNPDGQQGGYANAFRVMGPPPQLLSLSPAQGNVGQTLAVTIAGGNFQTGALASFGAGITINSVTVVSSAQLTASVTVASGATVGLRDVTVTNADGQSITLPSSFRVLALPPTVVSLSPAIASRGSTLDVMITGSAFVTGAMANFGAGTTVNATLFISSSSLKANVTVDSGAALGLRTVTVTNPDGQAGTKANSFEVAIQGPSVLSIIPEMVTPCGLGTILIKGKDFQSGVTVDFGSGISVDSLVFENSARLVASVTVSANAAKGPRTVTVQNPDGKVATVPGLFTVKVPTYTSTSTTYTWIDASGGTPVGISGDDTEATVPIGFEFPLYGVNYAQVKISTNGYLTFGTGSGVEFVNRGLPSSLAPAPLIAVFWGDLYVPAASGITYQVFGEAPSRQLVVQWTGVRPVAAAGTLSFQVMLCEGSGDVLVQYQDVVADDPVYDYGARATVGIQDEYGTTAVQLSHNTAFLANATAYLMSVPSCHAGCIPPAAPVISGPQMVCAGMTATLDAGPGYAAYSWDPEGQTTRTITVTPSVTTIYGVRAANAEGCAQSSGFLLAVAAPPASPLAANDGPVCAGGTVHLTASGVAGATYSWTGPNGFTSAAQNPVLENVSVASGGTYTVLMTSGGCMAAARATTVVVNVVPGKPVITAPASAPAETSGLVASVPATAGSSYSWIVTNGTMTAGQGTNQITFSVGPAPGTAAVITVAETTEAGCVSPEGAIIVSVGYRKGDVNGDNSVNTADIFYLINYLFAGGSSPIGPGDVNADNSVNTADVFYLINYLFAGGPAPM